MKKTILLFVSLSLVPFFAQARTAVKPAPKPPSMKAFGYNPNATKVLGPSALVIDGLDPSVRAYANGTLGSGSLGSETTATLKEGFDAIPDIAFQVKDKDGVEAITVALTESSGWDAQSRNNVVNFAKSLTDGVNATEAAKLKEVKENCRL